jgi:oligopeptide/dipeptide ABC transporter ATP-binding protein
MADALLTIDHASVLYGAPGSKQGVLALDQVCAELWRGMTLGVVGESGCGKSTLAQAIVNLVPLASGEIRFGGQSIQTRGRRAEKLFRRGVQLVFQDPQSSLNPRMRMIDIIAEPLVAQRIGTTESRRQSVMRLVEQVGLPLSRLNSFPHEFSGGQRQRISLARALILEPKVVVLDEPTSALDVSVQAQILNLLLELQDQHGLSFILISHDVSVVRHLADAVLVMYLGQVVEQGPATAVLASPRHPYTRELLASVPTLSEGNFLDAAVRPNEPSSDTALLGCRFRARCPFAIAGCEREQNLEMLADEADRAVRCWRAAQLE